MSKALLVRLSMLFTNAEGGGNEVDISHITHEVSLRFLLSPTTDVA